MIILLKNKHTLKFDDFYFKCSIGKNGTSLDKLEGDKKTPKGVYSIENLYYRNDRLIKPFTKLKCIPIKQFSISYSQFERLNLSGDIDNGSVKARRPKRLHSHSSVLFALHD